MMCSVIASTIAARISKLLQVSPVTVSSNCTSQDDGVHLPRACLTAHHSSWESGLRDVPLVSSFPSKSLSLLTFPRREFRRLFISVSSCFCSVGKEKKTVHYRPLQKSAHWLRQDGDSHAVKGEAYPLRWFVDMSHE